MNLNKEEQDELETCINSAKVMYFSQAVKMCEPGPYKTDGQKRVTVNRAKGWDRYKFGGYVTVTQMCFSLAHTLNIQRVVIVVLSRL